MMLWFATGDVSMDVADGKGCRQMQALIERGVRVIALYDDGPTIEVVKVVCQSMTDGGEG